MPTSVRRLEPYADQLVTGRLRRGVGDRSPSTSACWPTTIGDWAEAEAHFAAAAATHERIGAPTWLARTRLEWARMLLLRRAGADDAERAATLRQALATARERVCRSIEREAVALLSGA